MGLKAWVKRSLPLFKLLPKGKKKETKFKKKKNEEKRGKKKKKEKKRIYPGAAVGEIDVNDEDAPLGPGIEEEVVEEGEEEEEEE